MTSCLRIVLIVLGLLAYQLTNAQDTDSLTHATDTLSWLDDVPESLGIKLGMQVMMSPSMQQYRLSSEFWMGIAFKGITGGFFRHQFNGEVNRTLIFPNEFTFTYEYGGGYLNGPFFRTKSVDINGQLNIGFGDATWKRQDSQQVFERDRFWTVHPQLLVYYKPIRGINVCTGIGYRYMNNLEMVNVQNNDLTGFTASLGLMLVLVK
ncbi:hypothetical protein [Marinoscillum furvescens]|uniref:Outer membrane protein with beta-barrel domain n=1 Tax=Marinoscillum furvescens DSM 4134 TaxID=1122208 RepID=A0A3D9L115_MARFU|nr:hypothetical protein [Marinoscillum furvescens]RED97442.1 hypothetical protein C7460_11251 [Marinoscillum furvescens DSM 4134]